MSKTSAKSKAGTKSKSETKPKAAKSEGTTGKLAEPADDGMVKAGAADAEMVDGVEIKYVDPVQVDGPLVPGIIDGAGQFVPLAVEPVPAVAASPPDELTKLRTEIDNLRNRLSAVTVTDQLICQAEIEAAVCQREHEAAASTAREAKKRFDKSVERLRGLVNDRINGQANLLDYEAKQAAVPDAVPSKSKGKDKAKPEPKVDPKAEAVPAVAPAEPSAAVVPATEDDKGDESESATTAPEIAPAASRRIDARIGSVSVEGDGRGEMLSLPPGVCEKLIEAGLPLVRDVWPLARDGKLKVKGVGPVSVAQIKTILAKWVGEDASAGDGPVARGEATSRYCEGCRERFPMADESCPTCGTVECHEIGFYGNQSADQDGDIVADCESLSVVAMPPSAILVTGSEGRWRSGWMVKDVAGEEIGAYPNVLKPAHATRVDAMTAAAVEMRRYVESNDMTSEIKAWERAVSDRCGVSFLPF